ncbi:MAG: hypothetical protein JKY08_00065, partial [Flavobacteriaceae bacterium]|nr:hypothetical protein [Flavobacteriaceae bacterium]
MENIEEFKIIASVIISATGLFTVLHKLYKNEKSKRILSQEEVDFILSRAEGGDQLTQELPLLRERQLIEKAYGFSVSREEFNCLALDLKDSEIRLTQLKRIKNYLISKNKKAGISLGVAEWVLLVLNTLCAFVFLAIAIIIIIWAPDEPFSNLKILSLFAAILLPVY